jgi:ribonuclease R
MMSRWQLEDDPNAVQEAQRYARPIPSRQHLLALLADRDLPMSFESLVEELKLEDPRDCESLRKRLRAMERDGQIFRNRREGYGLLDKMDLVRGRVAAQGDGYGSVIPDDGGDALMLSPREMRAVLHHDRVVARVTGVGRRGRRQGAIVEILESNTQQVVGRFIQEEGIGFVHPDNKRLHQDILIPPESAGNARDGQIVVAEIVKQPSKRTQPIGRIREVVGDHLAPGMEIDLAIRAHQLPAQWPEGVLQEVHAFPGGVPESAVQGRVDLRSLPLVTIDGADAKDFDDAVCCERRAKGWKLWVAIADVSAYVAPGTALDAEAEMRGNSVYFPGRVIPMLPEVLSNGLCSLNPEVDRLCIVCEMFIDDQGRIGRSRFLEAVMRSKARLTYSEVAEAIVQRKVAARRRLGAVVPQLEVLYDVYRALKRAREVRGAIEIDAIEPRIVFGHDRKIVHIEPMVRNDAHRIIEECMVAANVAAARFVRRHKMPSLFRVHDRPTTEKVADLRTFLGEMGLRLEGGDRPSAEHYSMLIRRVQGRPEARLIETVLLRSLAQAVYSPEHMGHFGLGLECYTHFTSPIRRYPDLWVHRAIRDVLRGNGPRHFDLRVEALRTLGDHCSMTERRADEATRDATDRLKCEFMLDKVGDVFSGLITNVTSFGLFVELDDIYVEGLVHISALGNDYYHFDPIHHRLLGDHTRQIYRLADPITVQVVRVDVDERKIDFELAHAIPKRSSRAQRRRPRRGRRAKRLKAYGA